MPTYKDFKLPDLGEGLTEGEILHWLVAVGDTVTLNQPIVEVETAKAAVEIPSPYAGVVTTLHHAGGDTVDVGSPIISFDIDPDGDAAATGGGERAGDPGRRHGAVGAGHGRLTGAEGRDRGEDRGPGRQRAEDGQADPAGAGRADGTEAPVVTQAERPQPARVSAAAVGAERLAGRRCMSWPSRRSASSPATSASTCASSAAADRTAPSPALTSRPRQAAGAPELARSHLAAGPDFDPATREQRIPIKGVRKATAAAMVQSAFTAPHVTEFVTVDVTQTMELVAAAARPTRTSPASRSRRCCWSRARCCSRYAATR